MDEKLQDRIDDYLLNRMDDAEKTVFLHEIEHDEGKKRQLEFTQNVRDSIRSREEKLQAMAQFQRQYEKERRPAIVHFSKDLVACDGSCPSPSPVMEEKPVRPKRRVWFWVAGVAAVLIVGFFAVKPMLYYESSPDYNGTPTERMRGGDDVFWPATADSTETDTVKANTGKIIHSDE
ncbi:MAG: hypothetical protein ACI3Y5_03540 [Prevotella sp.]